MSFASHDFTGAEAGTLADLLSWAEAEGEPSDALYELRKVPARLGLAEGDLGTLPADRGLFERKIAPAPYGPVSRARDLKKARERGNSRLRALLTRYLVAQSLRPIARGRADWDRMIAFVQAREGFVERGAPFTTGTHRSLLILRARVACPPAEFDQAEVARIGRELSAGKRKTLVRALQFVNRLRETFGEDPELAGLLPPAALHAPAGSGRARRMAWDELPPALRVSAEAAMERVLIDPETLHADALSRIRAGECPLQVKQEIAEQIEARKGKRGVNNDSAARESWRSAVTWLARAAEDIGHDLKAFEDLSALMVPGIIESACAQQITRSAAAEDLKAADQSQTLNGRLTALRTLAKWGLRDKAALVVIDFISEAPDYAKCCVRPGSQRNEEADRICRMIQRAPHLAASFVNAPEFLAQQAEEALAAAQARGNRAAELTALRLYASAAEFAVQVSRPLRPANLIRLRHRNAGNLPANLDWIRPGKVARLTFQRGEIKNDRVITVYIDGAEARILHRWMTALRPRYMALKGVPDSVYVFPGEAQPRHLKKGINMPEGCLAVSTMGEIWREGADRIGLSIKPHQARHVVATLILAMEPGNFAKVAAVLGDTEETVRKHYGVDSGEQAAREVRAALKARHPDLFRKLKRKAEQ